MTPLLYSLHLISTFAFLLQFAHFTARLHATFMDLRVSLLEAISPGVQFPTFGSHWQSDNTV